MSGEDREPERLWERGWEGHALAQRRRLAALPLSEKLRWLEEAQRLVGQIQRARDGESHTKPGPDDSKR